MVTEIINGKIAITPSIALRLAKFFRVSPDFWMNIQLRWDLYFAKKSESDALKMIKPLPVLQIQTNPAPNRYELGYSCKKYNEP